MTRYQYVGPFRCTGCDFESHDARKARIHSYHHGPNHDIYRLVHFPNNDDGE